MNSLRRFARRALASFPSFDRLLQYAERYGHSKEKPTNRRMRLSMEALEARDVPSYSIYEQAVAANGTAVSGRTPSPTTYLGSTWTTSVWGPGATSATIQGDTLQASGYAPPTYNNRSFMTINTGASNETITANFTLGSRDNEYSYVEFPCRFQDINNWVNVTVIRSGTVPIPASLYIRTVSGGIFCPWPTQAMALTLPTVLNMRSQ